MLKKLFNSLISSGGSNDEHISDLDDAIHIRRKNNVVTDNILLDSTIDCTIDRSRMSTNVDEAIHVRRRGSLPSSISIQPFVEAVDDDIKQQLSIKSIVSPSIVSPCHKMDQFEQKFRSFIQEDIEGAEDIIDDIYHDDVVHMMDGLPQNKSQIKQLYIAMLKDGLKRSIKSFNVLDNSHVEAVIHTKNEKVNFLGRSLITLKDGKIVWTEKIESVPECSTLKKRVAMAA